MARVFSTQGIKALNSIAVSQGFNRSLTNAALRRLDPEGFHVAATVFDHNDDHLRVEILLKMAHELDPTYAFIDMTYEDFERYGVEVSARQPEEV